jgi:hypothetical protein
MALRDVPRCQHVKVNGVQCGSPALRRKAYCYFHERAQYERERAATAAPGTRTFGFPLLEDANSIQVALMKVLQMLGAGVLDHKTAALMLYGLQTASANLRSTKFEPEKSTDVVIDEDTVDLTRIKGPQWSMRNFHQKAEPGAGKQADPAAPSAERSADAAANPNAAVKAPILDKELIDYATRREEKRKLPEESDDKPDDQPTMLVSMLLKRLEEQGEKEEPQKEERQKQEEENKETESSGKN